MESYVERTLQSAVNQTYRPLEIIVIDDGSTDRTLEVIRNFAASNSCVRVVPIENSGVAAARNLGTELATTPFVAYLDADDLWHPRKIELQVASLLQHGCGDEWAASYTYFRRIDEFDDVIRDGPEATARGSFFEEHLHWNPIGNGSSILVKREVALAVGGFNPAYARAGIGGCEDLEFQLKLLKNHKIELVPEYLVGYRYHERQMSRDIRRMQLSRIAVLDTVLSNMEPQRQMQRKALARSHLIAVRGFIGAGDWSGASRHLARGLRYSVSEALGMASKVAADVLRTRIAGTRSAAPGLGSRQDGSTFDLYDPSVFSSRGKPIKRPVSLSRAAIHVPDDSPPPSVAE